MLHSRFLVNTKRMESAEERRAQLKQWGPSLEKLKEDRLRVSNFHPDMRDEEGFSFFGRLLFLSELEETLELLREMACLVADINCTSLPDNENDCTSEDMQDIIGNTQ